MFGGGGGGRVGALLMSSSFFVACCYERQTGLVGCCWLLLRSDPDVSGVIDAPRSWHFRAFVPIARLSKKTSPQTPPPPRCGRARSVCCCTVVLRRARLSPRSRSSSSRRSCITTALPGAPQGCVPYLPCPGIAVPPFSLTTTPSNHQQLL